MYEAFFGLNKDPFRLRSDQRFSFAHPSYRRAKASLQYALRRAEGFVMVTGRLGTGKTTLIHELIADLPPDEFVVGYLSVTQLGAEDLLRMAAHAFGLSADGVKKAQVLVGLMDFLEQKYRHSFQSLLIIDEAQDLSPAALEEIRLLNNLQHRGQPLLQIILLGQDGLRELFRRPEMEQVHQRLIAAWHLEPLTSDETAEYVQHRLETAGWKGDPVLETGVLRIVHEFSEGIPRRINLICSRLFLHAFVAKSHRITQADAEEAARDLFDEELAQPLDDRKDARSVSEDQIPQVAPPTSSEVDRDAAGDLQASDSGVWTQIDQGLYGSEDRGAEPPAGNPTGVGEAARPVVSDMQRPKRIPVDAQPPRPVATVTAKPGNDANRKPAPTRPQEHGGKTATDIPKVGAKPASSSRPSPKVTVYTMPLPDTGENNAVKPVPEWDHPPSANVDPPGVNRRKPVVDVRRDTGALDLPRDARGGTEVRTETNEAPLPRITASPAVHIAAERDEARHSREDHTSRSRSRKGSVVTRRGDRIGVVMVVSLFVVTLAFALYTFRSAPPDAEVVDPPSPAEVAPPPIVEPAPVPEAAEPPVLPAPMNAMPSDSSAAPEVEPVPGFEFRVDP